MKFTTANWINVLKSGRKFYKTADLMKLSGLDYTACRAAANRLSKKGLLIRYGKELFGNRLQEPSQEEAACQAYLPSYLSCEYALSRHGVIDQMPVVLTAVTTRRGRKAVVGRAEVIYEHLRKKLFWGYTQDGEAFIAEPEKALLDWLYLAGGRKTPLDEINWGQLNIGRLKKYASNFPHRIQGRLKQYLRP